MPEEGCNKPKACIKKMFIIGASWDMIVSHFGIFKINCHIVINS